MYFIIVQGSHLRPQLLILTEITHMLKTQPNAACKNKTAGTNEILLDI
jgi:hypothetical protein